MRSSEIPCRHRRNRLWAIAVLCLSGLGSQPAQAHVISILHGTASVLTDRIDVELTVNAEDFVHSYGASADPGHSQSGEPIDRAAARHAVQLLEHFIIRSADGERLSGRLVSRRAKASADVPSREVRLRAPRIIYGFQYVLNIPPRFLSFQQTLGAGDVALPAQLYLDVRAGDSGVSTTLRLTSGGNLETLQFRWPDAAGAAPKIIGPLEELKSIAARFEIDEAETRIQIDLPLPLLETFLPLRRADRDFLDPSEQQAARSVVQEFLRGHLPLHINGHSAAPRDVSVAFLTLDSTEAAAGALQRVSAWTTRVRAIQSYATSSMPQAIELRWTLFNPLVLEVPAVIARGHQESTHRLSTYQPTLLWKRTATGELDGHRTARSSR